jgi:recombination protein RecR
MLPSAVENLIKNLSRLPAIGRRSAQRLTLHLIKQETETLNELGQAILQLKTNVRLCQDCFNFAENEICQLCLSEKRDQATVCIVEDVLDVIAVENSEEYQGLYHVLHGRLSPLDGVGPDDLKINELISRLDNHPEIRELILATGTSLEGETTANYLADILKQSHPSIKISRISQGMPIGGELDYADNLTLRRAFSGRRELD